MKKLILTCFTLILMASLCSCSTSDKKNAGMVIGGAAGGLAGSAITGGSTAGTIVGAVGGAFLGRELAN